MSTLISLYPNCLSKLAHKEVTLAEVYDLVKNNDMLRQRTANYRKALESIPSLVAGCYKTAAPMHVRKALPKSCGSGDGAGKGETKIRLAAPAPMPF